MLLMKVSNIHSHVFVLCDCANIPDISVCSFATDDTFSTSRDYEKLRKEITVLRSHLDKVAREKNGAQYRYQTVRIFL